jgi:hypothetical protein
LRALWRNHSYRTTCGRSSNHSFRPSGPYLRDWQQAGLWDRILHVLLDRLGYEGRIDWSRASTDSGSVRAKGGGEQTGRNPTDRGKLGSKHHIIVDRNGILLAPPMLTPVNQHDSIPLNEVLDSIKPIRQRRGPLSLPAGLHTPEAVSIRYFPY